jgi:hypothetical protein
MDPYPDPTFLKSFGSGSYLTFSKKFRIRIRQKVSGSLPSTLVWQRIHKIITKCLKSSSMTTITGTYRYYTKDDLLPVYVTLIRLDHFSKFPLADFPKIWNWSLKSYCSTHAEHIWKYAKRVFLVTITGYTVVPCERLLCLTCHLQVAAQ